LSIVEHQLDLAAPRISEAGVADYIALLKPRVMSLVVFTALAMFIRCWRLPRSSASRSAPARPVR
jgi:heme O synthase-like polyprenyltransferase